uniref:Uncharacterized protein n=1 Tax=Magnetospirillum gryphiswaldense TaxID=55518 RepID=A4U0Y9_9PROT|nr:hypothetical protein MGR_1219 [Magnetospirillum gryphiswaldense MSR-1]
MCHVGPLPTHCYLSNGSRAAPPGPSPLPLRFCVGSMARAVYADRQHKVA